MSRYIVFVAMLLSIYVIRKKGLESAFLYVWIPFFLVMPTSLWVNIPGLPDPNFMQAAIIPLLFVLVRDKNLKISNIGIIDILIFNYCLVRIICDYLMRGYTDAQNYAFYVLTSMIGPYLLGRYIISSQRMDINTSVMFIIIFIIFFPMHVYELRFWVSPIYKVMQPFFPESFNAVTLRYGLVRTAGTFEHPILACLMIVIVYRLHRWLYWIGFWKTKQHGLLKFFENITNKLPFEFHAKISFVLIIMAIMTISRAPWIAAFAGAMVAMVGLFKKKSLPLALVLGILVFGGLGGKIALDIYTTPEIGKVLTQEASTMLYRKQLFDEYMVFFFDKIWTGWGVNRLPQVHGQESMDNGFFLIALTHGIVALCLMLLIFGYAIFSQLKFGLSAETIRPPISFTFASIYVICLIAFSTVYMGGQTEPLLFMLFGWGENVKRRQLSNIDFQSNELHQKDGINNSRIIY